MPRLLKDVFLPIALAIISSITTIIVGYITVVRPQTEAIAEEKGAGAGGTAGGKAADAVVDERVPPSQEVAVAVDVVTQNRSARPLLIVALCGASHSSLEIEGWVGETAERLALVASSTGQGRMTFTLPVLPGRWYHVRETTGRFCGFRGWTL